ncbi:hypothetical protein [Campylobacter concisus]|uniref:hypothetical protein n=1 Tax=Campylobacter concisus TaxID=199 RepID=UPI000CD89951|nr:hypothetical protein [Campylobacter concisus]
MIEMNNLYFWIDSVFGFLIVGLSVAIYSEIKKDKDNVLNNNKKEIEDHEIVEIELSELEEIEILPSNNNKR